MTSLPSAEDDQDQGGTPGIGNEEGGEGDMDYLDRQQDQGGYAEISDHQGNNFMVSLEDLAAVGVDINRQLEISEEQMRMLLSMGGSEDTMLAGPMKDGEYDETAANDQLTITVLPDGGVKLVAVGGHESFFSPSQLAEINIDTQNLSDDDIKKIVHCAQAAGDVLYDDMVERPEKRRKVESGAMGGMEERRDPQRMQSNQRNYQNIHATSHSAASTSSGHMSVANNNLVPVRNMPNGGRRTPIQNGLIGESVKIQNAKGKIVPAVVRYSRPGNGVQSAAYKVQTSDGKFEWIQPDRIIDRVPRMSDPRDYDHKGYTSEQHVAHLTAAPSTSNGGGMVPPRRVFTSTSGGTGGGGGGVGGQRVVKHIPVPLQSGPNFCCPVCDRKVYQKEPAYIVIRLPACDSCTREKILIVDEAVDTPEGGSGVSARPATRSIATDTSDLPTEEKQKGSEEIPSTTSPEEEAATPEGENEGVEKSVEEETCSMEETTPNGLQSPLVVQPLS